MLARGLLRLAVWDTTVGSHARHPRGAQPQPVAEPVDLTATVLAGLRQQLPKDHRHIADLTAEQPTRHRRTVAIPPTRDTERGGRAMAASVDNATKAERERLIAEAIHSTEMEGLHVTPAARADADEYGAGRVNSDQLVARTRARYCLDRVVAATGEKATQTIGSPIITPRRPADFRFRDRPGSSSMPPRVSCSNSGASRCAPEEGSD